MRTPSKTNESRRGSTPYNFARRCSKSFHAASHCRRLCGRMGPSISSLCVVRPVATVLPNAVAGAWLHGCPLVRCFTTGCRQTVGCSCLKTVLTSHDAGHPTRRSARSIASRRTRRCFSTRFVSLTRDICRTSHGSTRIGHVVRAAIARCGTPCIVERRDRNFHASLPASYRFVTSSIVSAGVNTRVNSCSSRAERAAVPAMLAVPVR
mmetsp:Transcript_461/g.1396  ORF Transcript_461/g.1396 Transcript_461/m.1396 type:complete len:208 (+) Transcript_461:1084-1707(+)